MLLCMQNENLTNVDFYDKLNATETSRCTFYCVHPFGCLFKLVIPAYVHVSQYACQYMNTYSILASVDSGEMRSKNLKNEYLS